METLTMAMTKRKTDRVFPISWFSNKQQQEEYHQQIRIENGIDPDEHTIYNVLCPAIRATWSKAEENNRRVCGKRIEALLQIYRDPEAHRAYSYLRSRSR